MNKSVSIIIAVIATTIGTRSCVMAQESSIPQVKHFIDTHIHLYDTNRADGVPWPPADDEVLYKPHLPEEYSKLAKAAGVTGVVVVEASDRLEDNRWVLDKVANDPFYVALVGNIDPYRTDFAVELDRTVRAADKTGNRVHRG